jgi:hypothetical protein
VDLHDDVGVAFEQAGDSRLEHESRLVRRHAADVVRSELAARLRRGAAGCVYAST